MSMVIISVLACLEYTRMLLDQSKPTFHINSSTCAKSGLKCVLCDFRGLYNRLLAIISSQSSVLQNNFLNYPVNLFVIFFKQTCSLIPPEMGFNQPLADDLFDLLSICFLAQMSWQKCQFKRNGCWNWGHVTSTKFI